MRQQPALELEASDQQWSCLHCLSDPSPAALIPQKQPGWWWGWGGSHAVIISTPIYTLHLPQPRYPEHPGVEAVIPWE